ncbi:MAG TPA: PPK2 family polyphosphate kinase [Vicinamibacterales bacterium]|nr:PPK2 family polyphosphate kinase [Vicinamibacterales bacterium]
MTPSRIDIKRLRVKPNADLSLARFAPNDTTPWVTRPNSARLLRHAARRLYELTELLYAQNRWSVLFVFQAMDGAGKDSAIKHVMRGLDPKLTQVFSFKTPSSEELRHDFLWRCMKALPERGRIGIFNRSYYEDVLVTRVHPALLTTRRLPKVCITPDVWKQRFEDISSMERYLGRNGTVICKLFLHVSKAEQRRRFLARLSDPAKRWKLSVSDVNERRRWTHYMTAYQEAIQATSSRHAPWYVVPADNKWFTHLAVAQIAIETLEQLNLTVPELSRREQRLLRDARRRLRA